MHTACRAYADSAEASRDGAAVAHMRQLVLPGLAAIDDGCVGCRECRFWPERSASCACEIVICAYLCANRDAGEDCRTCSEFRCRQNCNSKS